MFKKRSAIRTYVATLVGVIGAYCAYHVTVTPWIEPASIQRASAANVRLAPPQVTLDRDSIFPEGAWERGLCKVLYTKNSFLIFRDYQPKEDGTVDVWPVTVVIPSKESSSAAKSGSATNPILVRCPRAVLKLDRPVRLGEGFGKFLSGHLNGGVEIIRFPAQRMEPANLQPGIPPADHSSAFWFRTTNVHLTPQRVFTLEPVEFSLGPHRGSGSHLMIDLMQSTDNDALKHPRAQRLQLQRLDYLVIDPAAFSKSPSTGLRERQLAEMSEGQWFQNKPFRVTCTGPLEFDADSSNLMLRDQVVIEQVDDPRERLECVSLLLRFAKDESSQPPDQDNAPERTLHGGKMQLAEITAIGNPAQMTLPSRELFVAGSEVRYHLESRRISMVEDVVVKRGGLHLRATRLDYQVLSSGRLGEGTIMGPGRVTKSGKAGFQIAWQDKLVSEKDNARQRISLSGDVVAEQLVGGAETAFESGTSAQKQSIVADQMQLWLDEIPRVMTSAGHQEDRIEYQPDRLMARGNIQFETHALAGKTDQLNVQWVGATGPAPQIPLRSAETFAPSPKNPTTGDRLANSDARDERDARLRDRPTAYQFSGQQIDIRLSRHTHRRRLAADKTADNPTGLSSQLVDLVAKGDVSVSEVAPADGSIAADQLLRISGQRINVVPIAGIDSASPQHRFELFATIDGATTGVGSTGSSVAPPSPCILQGRGYRLAGQSIFLDRSVGRAWVPGAGTMNSVDGNFSVRWLGGLVFDGEQAYLERDVTASIRRFDQGLKATELPPNSPSETDVAAQALTVTLTEPVNLKGGLPNGVSLSRQSSTSTSQSISPHRPHASDIGSRVAQMVLAGELLKPVFAATTQPADGSVRTQPGERVTIANRRLGPGDQVIGRQVAQLANAIYQADQGLITGAGPGSIEAWQVGRPTQGPHRAVRFSSQDAGRENQVKGKAMTYTRVNFNGRLRGNLQEEKLTFSENVRVIHGRVGSLQQTLRVDDSPQPDEFRLTSDSLALDRWSGREGQRPHIEMNATGNASVTSQFFAATGSRISYNEQSEMIVMAGGSPSFVQMEHRKNPSGPVDRVVAETVRYFLKTNQTEVSGIKRGNFLRGGNR